MTLTRNNVINLLQTAAAFDRRQPSEAEVAAWLDAAPRGRWDLDTAAEAIKDYYATTTDRHPWVMPSHITAYHRATRAIPEQHHHVAGEIPTGPPAEPRTVAIVMAELRTRLGWRKNAEADDSYVREVECPYCHAGPKRPCTRLVARGPHRGEYMPLKSTHPSRKDIADRMIQESDHA